MKSKKSQKKLQYVICRCRDAGVHAGELLSDGKDGIVLVNARRLWYWAGAATLSELAVYGGKDPGGCKFPPEVARIKLRASDVCEIIYCQPAGEKMIRECQVWRA